MTRGWITAIEAVGTGQDMRNVTNPRYSPFHQPANLATCSDDSGQDFLTLPQTPTRRARKRTRNRPLGPQGASRPIGKQKLHSPS